MYMYVTSWAFCEFLSIDLESDEMAARRLAYDDVLDTNRREKLTGTWKDLLANCESDIPATARAEVRKAVAEGKLAICI